MRRAHRGQATTELALGSLVFITVLLFGIHFSEAGFAMLKAKEAAAFSMHAASGQRTHLFNPQRVASGDTYGPFDPAAAATDAQPRYRGARVGVLTQVGALTLQCSADNTVKFRLRPMSALGALGASALDYLDDRYQNRGGVSCRSEATMSLFRLPSTFADDNAGFFKEPHVKLTQIEICGAGMAKNGRCPGRLATLTGDWAFEAGVGTTVNGDVPNARTNEINNPAYEQVVRNLFRRSGGAYADSNSETPAQHMMSVGAGVNPGHPYWFNETAFNMSYLGENGGVNVKERRVAPSYNSKLKYQTTGADMENPTVDWEADTGKVKGVPPCFMGLRGC
ncbi:MAG: hypothetical protein IPJ65_27800 [Archangiaceae bacterium]|nr:hypothetical protein [Archangiaceae bacterium]